jgi:hypothetical protein
MLKNKISKMEERMGTILWLLTAAALGAWFGVMALDREPPFMYLPAEAGSKIVPNPANHGGMVSTDWHLTPIKRDCPRRVERVFENRDTGETVTTLDATPLSRAVLTSSRSLSRSFVLPEILPVHNDYYAIISFQCNSLHYFFPIVVITPKLPFDVVK